VILGQDQLQPTPEQQIARMKALMDLMPWALSGGQTYAVAPPPILDPHVIDLEKMRAVAAATDRLESIRAEVHGLMAQVRTIEAQIAGLKAEAERLAAGHGVMTPMEMTLRQ
jgi:hypothetical protein